MWQYSRFVMMNILMCVVNIVKLMILVVFDIAILNIVWLILVSKFLPTFIMWIILICIVTFIPLTVIISQRLTYKTVIMQII